jgi:hypothetical protein
VEYSTFVWLRCLGSTRMLDTRALFDLAEGKLSMKPMAVNCPDWKRIVEGFQGEEVLEFSANRFLQVLEG